MNKNHGDCFFILFFSRAASSIHDSIRFLVSCFKLNQQRSRPTSSWQAVQIGIPWTGQGGHLNFNPSVIYSCQPSTDRTKAPWPWRPLLKSRRCVSVKFIWVVGGSIPPGDVYEFLWLFLPPLRCLFDSILSSPFVPALRKSRTMIQSTLS
jgi:hypothetical protein